MKTKKISYNITHDPQFLDDQIALTSEQAKMLRRYHMMALKGKKSSVPKLLDAIKKYPDKPQLKNFLSVLYGQLNQQQKMFDVNKWIVAEHPNYLFGKLNMASEYYIKEKYDKMLEVLGPDMDLKSLCPHRETFHVSEVTSFLKLTIFYFTAVDNIEQAEIRYDILEELAPNTPETLMLNDHIYEATIRMVRKRYEAEQKTKISVITNPQEIISDSQEPIFYHPEIKELYSNGLDIEKEKLETILALPRETLLRDIESVVQDSINRFSFFQIKVANIGYDEGITDFIIHASYILGELKAAESINVIFKILSQSDDYLEFYLGEFVTDMLWEPLFKIATNNLQTCKEFLFKPGINTYARTNILELVEQIVIHDPTRKNEIINWFDDVIQFFLNSDIADNVIDSDFNAFLICSLIVIESGKLLPKIEKMYEKGIVSQGVTGSLSEVTKALAKPYTAGNKKTVLSIFDRYENIISTWAAISEEERYPEFDLSELFETPAKPIKVGKKIGRNEPCPCGSGKKYKKCCLN